MCASARLSFDFDLEFTDRREDAGELVSVRREAVLNVRRHLGKDRSFQAPVEKSFRFEAHLLACYRSSAATATPMSYTLQGRQYVLINAGGHAMYNRGTGDYLETR